jgi:hypothetical protein
MLDFGDKELEIGLVVRAEIIAASLDTELLQAVDEVIKEGREARKPL